MSEQSRKRDTRAASWAKKYARLMRNVVELRELGAHVRLPDNFDKAPHLRSGQPSSRR